MHSVSGGEMITAKHFLLALGVHNITGLQFFFLDIYLRNKISLNNPTEAV